MISFQEYKQGLVEADCPNPLILALLLLRKNQRDDEQAESLRLVQS